MIFKEQFTIQLKDIGKENYMKNRAILEIFENIGTHHSDIAGYGPNDIKRTGVTWVLLDWKVQVLKRPKYGEKLNVSTWGRTMKRTYTYRDFEMYDEENIGELIYFFEKACAMSGMILGVNPFNQPGVEEYKKNMFKLLKKPGY